MPGLGKTQLASQFASTNRKGYAFTFWISGASTEKLSLGYSNILEQVGEEAKDQNIRNVAVKRWLGSQQAKWLLVVDNVNEDTMLDLRDMLPLSNSQGNILITTRFKHVAESLSFAHGEEHVSIELQGLTRNDAVDLFFITRDGKNTSMNPSSKECHIVADIVQKVCFLPLAIDQAASFSKTSGQDVSTVLEVHSSPELSQAVQWDSDTSKHEKSSVMACFEPLLVQIQQADPIACDLLRIIAFLDPESVSIKMIKEGLMHYRCILDEPGRFQVLKDRLRRITSKPQGTSALFLDNEEKIVEDVNRLCRVFESPIRLQRTLRVLARSSVVKFKDNSERTLWIHDLVHSLTQQVLMNRNQQFKWLEIAHNIVLASFWQIVERYETRNYPLASKHAAHIQRLSTNFTIQARASEPLLAEQITISKYLDAHGYYTEAEKIQIAVIEQYVQLLGQMHPNTLRGKRTLAITYIHQYRFAEAEVLLVGLLAQHKKVFGENHGDTLVVLRDLSVTACCQRQFDTAAALASQVVSVVTSTLGTEHADTLLSKVNLAYIYLRQGRIAEAEALQQETLSIYRRLVGDRHLDTLWVMNGLAHTWRASHRDTQAIEMMETVVSSFTEVLGPDSWRTKNSITQLSNWRSNLRSK